jgi:transcriptional regulator with XRE-family HTH domain
MTSNATSRVAANIRAEVARQQIPQTRLAAALGLSQQAISRRLLGRTSLTVDELEAFASILNVEVAVLFGVDEPVSAA